MPKLSDTMTEGTLVSWKKKKGDNVSAGEVLAEIETDKATMEWESPEDGTLTEIYVEEGGKVNVGDKIAFIGGEGEEAPKEEGKEKPQKEKSCFRSDADTQHRINAFRLNNNGALPPYYSDLVLTPLEVANGVNVPLRSVCYSWTASPCGVLVK